MDEILQVLDQPHLLVSYNAVNFGLLSHVPEPEDLVRDGVIVVLLVGFIQEFLLQFPEAFVDDLWRQSVSLFDYRGDVGLQGFQKVVFFAEHLIDSLNDYLLQVFLIDRPGMAHVAGSLKPRAAAPDNGLVAPVVPVDAPEEFAAVTTEYQLGETVIVRAMEGIRLFFPELGFDVL
jgi:hypothetical protein